MQRRDFIKGTAGLGVAGLSDVASAQMNGMPTINWRLASSFPKSLDTIYIAAEQLAQRVSALTQGKFQIRTFAGGELVPGLQVLDAVQNGTVECGHSASYYYIGKNMAFAFDCAVPFGTNARQQNAWMYSGGGIQLMRDLFKSYNIIQFPGGNTGAQMGGWFRHEIHSLADLRGLKMRIPGLGGKVMAKMGVVPQTLPGSDIYPALETGAIDAAEWVGPYDDERLGFHKIAKNYYYPGWWEGGPQLSFMVNLHQWNSLPSLYQQAFEVAAVEANMLMLASYDARNPPALMRLIQQGVKLHAFPKDVMLTARQASYELYEEESAHNSAFKTIYSQWRVFLQSELQWFKVCESPYDNFMDYVK